MTSFEIADKLGVTHFEVMRYYWKLENAIVFKRNLIECTLCIVEESENYLKDCSPYMLVLMAVHFNKLSAIDDARTETITIKVSDLLI